MRSTPKPVTVSRQLGLVPGKGHKADGAEIVHLVGPGALDRRDERTLIEQVSLD